MEYTGKTVMAYSMCHMDIEVMLILVTRRKSGRLVKLYHKLTFHLATLKKNISRFSKGQEPENVVEKRLWF